MFRMLFFILGALDVKGKYTIDAQQNENNVIRVCPEKRETASWWPSLQIAGKEFQQQARASATEIILAVSPRSAVCKSDSLFWCISMFSVLELFLHSFTPGRYVHCHFAWCLRPTAFCFFTTVTWSKSCPDFVIIADGKPYFTYLILWKRQ